MGTRRRKKKEEEEHHPSIHPSTDPRMLLSKKHSGRLCACVRMVWYGIRKRDLATPQSSRELRDTKLQKRRRTEPACLALSRLFPSHSCLDFLCCLTASTGDRAPSTTPPTSRGWEGDAIAGRAGRREGMEPRLDATRMSKRG
jgi:hypothetical protein